VEVSHRLVDYYLDSLNLEKLKQIGAGGSGKVVLFDDPETGKRLAVKSFPAQNFDRKAFIQEVEALATLNHPCVLRIVGWRFPRKGKVAQIHTELASTGSLEVVLDRVKSDPGSDFWTPTTIAIIICDIVLGMRYVHSRGIVHRDLKPSNILIRDECRALIGDFGSSRFDRDEGTQTSQSIGTLHYAAPEMMEESGDWARPVDVFAFGLILFEILVGKPVFAKSLYPLEVVRKLRSGKLPEIPDKCGQLMHNLISRCWSKEPSSRPSFDDILREFQASRFEILPGADSAKIEEIVSGVLTWEASVAEVALPVPRSNAA
jgi:serine/threonine protein kinase